jgi:potassium-dependent mechanosensitive channel
MKSCIRCLAVLVLFLAMDRPIFAQTPQQEKVTKAELRELNARVDKDLNLSEELRSRITELLDGAIAALENTDNNLAAKASSDRDRRGVDRMEADLKVELDRRRPKPRLALPENPTMSQAEDAVARERARLAANVSALREQQRLADDRSKTRADTSRRLGELDLDLELLNRDLRGQVDSSAPLEFKTAARLHTLARIEDAKSEVEMLRARLALLADRSSLVPLNTDLAQRRVAISEELVALHVQKAEELRFEQSRRVLARVHDLSLQVAEDLPQLAALAAETEALAELLLGEDGIISAAEQTSKDLAATRNFHAQLNRISELTTRKFEAYGHRGSIQRWWPDVPDDFPKPGSISRVLRGLEEEIPEVEHQLITYEQQRAGARIFGRVTINAVHEDLGDAFTPELEDLARKLLSTRQDLIDQVIQKGGRYSNLLAEYRTVAENFLIRVEDVEKFLYSHILWSRSVPRPIIPRVRDLVAAMGWLTSSEHAEGISIIGVDFSGNLLLTTLVLGLILVLRPTLKRRLVGLADRAKDPQKNNVGLTVQAMIVSGLLAAPLPMALFLTGMLVDRVGESVYWMASSKALIELAIVAALIEAIRQIFAPRGLAEVYFGWPITATRPLHRGLVATEALGFPLLYVALHLAFAGMRLDSSEELQLYNNTLGRMAFITALLVFGLSILSMLRPERKTEPSDTDTRVPWPARFAEYAFPTAFLGAYPIIIFATIVPVILAVFGYYLTGLLLSYQMLRTLLVATLVMAGGGLVHRSRANRRDRLLLEGEEEASETQLRELETAEKQTSHLFRFAMAVILAVGLYTIWSDALPMLQMLKRVQLLPKIELLQPVDDSTASIEAIANTGDGSPAPKTDTDGSDSAPAEFISPSGPQGSSPDPPTPDQGHPLTLWLFIEAILAATVTIVLARNMPGVIEITLKRRTTLDAGARFAFSTLVKYTITIVGSVVVFNLLGIGWSKVQWLAAALTFGLAFGLQEIVANFVSGLILLVERPIRVGDVVTIGNLMGKVSRIQIRATTITLWDRSEMVVPNKEFITTKLVNWTLSDSKRRIEIPLRVMYGADLDKVKSLLVSAAEAHPLVLDDPAPQALLLTFGDDAINFELRFVVDFGNGIKAKDDVQMAIDKAFRANGIGFALPQLRLDLPKSGVTVADQGPVEDGDRETNR